MFFFEPDNSRDVHKRVTESLISDSFVYTSNMENTRILLGKETEKQGLRGADLAELTGWSPSKTSKLTAGKQKLTAEDTRIWARALGYTPDPFINEDADIRFYKLDAYIRKPSDVLEAYFDASDDSPEHTAIVNYELPLSILSMLGVKLSDYAIRANASYFGIDPYSKKGFGNTATSIRFWQRTTSSGENMTPEFGLWISPDNDFFLSAVYLNRRDGEGGMSALRATYKDALQIEESDAEAFDSFAKENKDWFPQFLKKGEIVAVGASTNNLPGPGDLENVLIRLFKQYCALVWEVKGIDLLPEKYKQREELSVFQQYDILTGAADFPVDVKEEILQRENYKCENDPTHKTFIDANGKPYMETAPIVPFSVGAQFGQTIFQAENGACLCPICRAKMRYGTLSDREDMILKLFRKHQKALQEKGIEVTLTQVFTANGLGQ
jgi:transcriptional regulator with XRE-family HTH domain